MTTKYFPLSLAILVSALCLAQTAATPDGRDDGFKFCATLVTDAKTDCMKAVTEAKYMASAAVAACQANNPWDADKAICIKTIQDGHYQAELAKVCSEMTSDNKISCLMIIKDKVAKLTAISSCTDGQFWKEDVLNCLKSIIQESTPTPSPSIPPIPTSVPVGTCDKAQVISDIDATLALMKDGKASDAISDLNALETELKRCLPEKH